MRSKEFLKALLKSLKSGRLHRFLKLLLVCLLLFFSYQVSVSVLKYWIKEKEELTIVKRNFHLAFNWKNGELSLKADYLFLRNPKFYCELYSPELDVNVYSSLKELRPVVSFIGLSEGKLVLKKREKKRMRLPFEFPFLVERANIGRFTLKWSDGYGVLNKFVYSRREFLFGGLNGSLKGKEFFVAPFTGVKADGYFLVPEFSAGYGGFRVDGKLRVYSLNDWQFSGSFVSSIFVGELNVKNYGKLQIGWKGRLKGIETEGKGTLSIKRDKLIFEQVSGNLDGADFLFSGEAGKRLRIEGKVHAERFNYRNYSAQRIALRFSVDGDINSPSLRVEGNVSRFVAPEIELSRIKVRGTLERGGGELRWTSESLDGKVTFSLKEKLVKGTVNLKDLKLKSVPLIRFYSEKYKSWIPELTVSGRAGFRLKGNSFDYRGSLRVEQFCFQGFKASGTVNLEGDQEKLKARGELIGEDGGEISGEVDLFLKKREIRSSYSVQSVPVEIFRFLKKVGLSGSVNGRGRVWGSLKNPQADFSVSSKNLKFQGIELGKSEGEVKLKDFILSVSAVTDRGVLDELRLKLKGKREFYAEGKVNRVSGKEVEKVLKGLKVHLPFEIEGSGSGSFSIYSQNIKEKKSLQVSVNVERFSGSFSYKGLTAEGDAEGKIGYRNGRIYVDLSGNLERSSFNGKTLVGGSYRVTLREKELSVDLENSRYAGGSEGFENSISGDVWVDIGSGSLKGRGKVTGRYSLKGEGKVVGSVDYSFSGNLSKFTVKISGKLDLQSKITGKKELKVKGAVLEPDNLGTITVSDRDTKLKVIANGKQWQAVGFIRNLTFKTQRAKAKVNMAFVNINLTDLTGTIAVPAFKVYPENFYPMYAVSGIYISLKKGEPELSDVTLSYVDGWIKLKDITFNRENRNLKGRIEARIGAKGLVYLAGAQKFIPYIRHSFSIEGEFSYGRNFLYRVNIDGAGIEFKTKYLLDRAVVNSLEAIVENGSLEKVDGEIGVGSGSLLLKGEKGNVNVTASLIPAGEVGKWKGLISGKVNYGEGELKGNLTVSKAKLFIGKGKKGKEQEGAPPKLPVNLDINLLFDQPLKIKGELFSLTLIPKLWIKTVNGRVVIGGTFYVTDGKIDYMGKEFKVIYGTGTIEDLEKEKGRVSILASAYVSGYYVYMKIEGELSSLTIYLSSDPPLTREQILNLIMTGASPEEIEASSELFPAVQVAYYATASLFKPFETKFKKTLKLESFSIEPYITKYGETVAKLTVAKRLAERIRLVGYGTTGQNPEYGGSVQLFIKRNYYLELRYNSYYGLEAGIGLEVNKR